MKETMIRLHRSEQGAEGLEKLLIIGAIVLPLLGLLIIFRGDLTDWVKSIWVDTQDDADNYDPSL
jgi:Flp pilus assembly pilin Flp